MGYNQDLVVKEHRSAAQEIFVSMAYVNHLQNHGQPYQNAKPFRKFDLLPNHKWWGFQTREMIPDVTNFPRTRRELVSYPE